MKYSGTNVKDIFSTSQYIVELITDNGAQFSFNLCSITSNALAWPTTSNTLSITGDFEYINFIDIVVCKYWK